jgi:SIS domain
MSFSRHALSESKQVIDRLDLERIERMADLLAGARSRGRRLFILGVGGSAANASHAVNDFRKIAHLEDYAPPITSPISPQGRTMTDGPAFSKAGFVSAACARTIPS